MCCVGRIEGASTSDPIATCTYSPFRTTEKRSEPHVRQRESRGADRSYGGEGQGGGEAPDSARDDRVEP